jgi:choline dehydrogenase-like flavoprotein
MGTYEVIVIGTGAGVSALARHIEPSDTRVLSLERGCRRPREPLLAPRRLHQERDPALNTNFQAHEPDNLYVVDRSALRTTGAATANALSAGDRLPAPLA